MAGQTPRAVGAPASAPPRGPAIEPQPCPMRHCWVADAADGLGIRRPGLLLEWRPVGAGWQGRVLYAAQLRSGRWAAVEEWVPAALLTAL